MKKRGIFIKVFAYTLISAALLVCVTAVLFSQQFMSFYRAIETREIVASYEPLVGYIRRGGSENIAEAARLFYENNQSFEFNVVDNAGGSLYATPNADTDSDFDGDFYFIVHRGEDYSIIAQSRTGLNSFYNDLAVRAIAVFAVMLALCLVCAYIFARQMTKPIKRLANNTGKMARLEDVPREPERRDELGDLARDVHAMYEKLKDTIAKLEDEILREREMEETQRYFFSAASHELKTPIAATSVLLEGMLENIGDYSDHPKYLRECIKLTDAQSKTVSEILEIVNLSDGKILPVPKRLDLGDTVASILPNYRTLAEAKDQQISAIVPEKTIVSADSQMLNKVLSNVILNAVQNAPSGAAIRIWSEPLHEHCRLCVLNTNTHIDEDMLPKLFDPFYRADKARNRKDKRSGLGLTIVQKSLKAMNIDFSLANTAEGVLFWMDLPKG
jgi:two-component system sensor histidine kinase VanS